MTERVVLISPEDIVPRIHEAVALASDSDVAVLVVGDNEITSREAWAASHLGDRPDLDFPGQQEELVRAVLDTGTPVVLILINGRPMAIPDLVEDVPAVIEGWYLGQDPGTAIAEVLMGDYNPARIPLHPPPPRNA